MKIPMQTWNTEEVVKWLQEEVNIGDAKTTEAIEDYGFTGEQLINIELDELKGIVPSSARCSCIIEERDNYIKRQREALEYNASTEIDMNEGYVSELVEPFRKFDSIVDITDTYQQFSHFPPAPSRPTDLIEPFRRFVPLESIDIRGPTFENLAKEVIAFGAACLNDSTNGVIHFGVREGQIRGLVAQCDKLPLDRSLTQKIKKSFHESQVAKILKCIRPMRWIQVRTGEGPIKRFVIEVDVEPATDLCCEDVFLVKNSTMDLYTFGENGPFVLEKDKYLNFIKEKPSLVTCRRKKESSRNIKTSPRGHRQNLVNILCRGKTRLREGEYPILVLPPAADCLTPDIIESKFSFLRHIEWKAVFDFGADRTFLDCMTNQDRLFKIRDVDEFDAEGEDVTILKNIKEDAYNSHVPNWILMNGDSARDCKPKYLAHWKKDTEDACRACFKTYTKGFKSSRVLIVFLLHSKSSDVFIDACIQLCVLSENFVCISEDENTAKTWQAGMMKYQYINKDALIGRIVAGLPWEFVGETVREITNNEPHAMCKVPTSIGDQVLCIRKELYDLRVLGSNECDNDKVIDNTEKLHELLKKKEAEFYKGGKVDWWNFWSDGVCTRDIFSSLYNKVRTTLFDEVVEGEIEQGIKTITLYHQPGSGGTTCARHVLWYFRKDVKCAEIIYLTDNTCSQIVKLRDFGESISQDPRPPLLLIDNKDRDKTLELLTNLKKQSEMRDRNATKQVYCVCLIVDRRSNLPNIGIGKHEQFDCLRQQLSPHEQVLFQKQSDRIQEKHPIRTLIAFNIMKVNFDPLFIKDNVASLIKDITKTQELFLLKYLAFINFYDISQKGVECSAFDEVMGAGEDPHWEDYLSDALNVLVIQEYSDSGHRVIKISHHKLSEEILENMKMRKTLLSEFTIELLSHRFLRNKISYATVNLRRFLAGIVKQRGTNAIGHREAFAPLILQIKSEESSQAAATVMEKVYELTDDAFVAQQLARLYIDSESWESAEDYASLAANKHPDNYHLLDTKGQVYRHKLEKHYKMNSTMVGHNEVTVSSILDKVKEAYKATTIFKQVQNLSHSLGAKNETAKPTISGQLGMLQIYASVLENLALLPVFAGGSRAQTSSNLLKFLHDPQYFPTEIASWNDDTTDDYMNFLKGIPEQAKETLRFVEDFLSHLNHGFIKSKDSDYEMASKREKRAVIALRDRLYKFILNVDTEETDAVYAFSRDAIWLLEGTSFNSLLDKLDLKSHSMIPSEGQQQETLQGGDTLVPRTSHLRSLLNSAKKCIKRNPNDFEALECLISVTLVISLYFEETDLAASISFRDVLEWSKKLYAIRNRKPKRLEPYLYYVMLHWPKARDREGQKSVSAAISSWKEVYLFKNPNMLANHAFYFTKGAELKSLVHRSQLYNSKKHRGDMFWKDEDIKEVLKRFTGTLDGKGSVVYLMDEETKENMLTIPSAYPIHDSSLWRNAVTFVIAFTFMGPKAYDVQRK